MFFLMLCFLHFEAVSDVSLMPGNIHSTFQVTCSCTLIIKKFSDHLVAPENERDSFYSTIVFIHSDLTTCQCGCEHFYSVARTC
jgi:hypothetical protein